jgi:iron complex transport system substrate-binding protein
MNRIYLLTIFVFLFCASCNSKKVKQNKENGKIECLKYAKLFNIEKHKGYKYINVLNNDGKTIYKLLIADNNKQLPQNNNADFVLKKAINNIGILSSTHIGFLNNINKAHLIQSSTNPQRIYDSTLFNKYKEGKIINIGDAMTTNVEQILALRPDVVFYTGYEQNKNTKRLLEKAGIAYVPIVEWKEQTILGRTEWIKFFGELFNKRTKSDSVFNQVVKRYNNLKKKTQNLTNKPTILYGNNFKGTWYMPGGKSYMAQILNDAGANYYFKNDTTKGSLHLSIESVIDIMQNADYWLSPSANTMKELEKADKHYKIFKAFKNGNVFNYTARVNTNGFNDYWESGVMNPDIILSDIIHILHPELSENYKLYYYKQLP